MHKAVKVNPVYRPLFKDQSRYLILYGGSGSGKSVFASMKVIRRVCEETPHKILVIRKVANTIKDSVFSEIKERIFEWGLSSHVHINNSEKYFNFDNGNQILCKGLDDQEKIKSISGITSAWIEEATELKEEDFDQLVLRVRGEKNNYVQFILSFNPIDEDHWIKRRLIDSNEADVKFVHTTYQDNKFLDNEYIQHLEGLKEKNDLYYQIYCLGEWGIVDKSNKFLYAFDQEKHVTENEEKDTTIRISFDFNIDPFCAVVYSRINNRIYFYDFISLANSDIYQVCDYINAKYPYSFLIVTGDASGKNRTGAVRGKDSYWRIIKTELRLKDQQIRLRGKNLGLIESRVLCNSALQHRDIKIDKKLTQLIKECKFAKVDESGVLVKDRKDNKLDQFDAWRYAIDIEFPELIRNPKRK